MAGVERQNVGGKSLTVCSVAPSGTWSEHASTLDKDTIHVRHFKLHLFNLFYKLHNFKCSTNSNNNNNNNNTVNLVTIFLIESKIIQQTVM